MALSCDDSALTSQPDKRTFFSLSVSPNFLEKQRKLIAIFVFMIIYGISMSSNLYKAAIKEDGYDIPELVARDVLDGLIKDCQKAAPKTFFVDSGPARLPHSRIGFHLQDGSNITYYEHDGSLYCERNGKSEKIFDGLLSAFFSLPSRSNRLLFAELQIWNGNETGNCSPSVIQRYIDVGPTAIASHTGKLGSIQSARLRRA